MATNIEEITVPQLGGVPLGALCIAEDSYNPSGLMQDMCDNLAALNTAINETYPGQYDSDPLLLTELQIELQMRCVNIYINGQLLPNGIPTVTNAKTGVIKIISNPNHNPNSPTSPTHQIAGTPPIPIILNCAKDDDGNFLFQEEINNSYNEIMKKARERVTRFYKEKFKRAVDDPTILVEFAGEVEYTGNKEVDAKRRRIIIDQGRGLVPIISRPFTKEEAPSLFPE